MFLKNYTENLRSRFTIFTLFAIAAMVFWCGANITTTNAQTPTPTPRRVPMDFTGDGRSDWATIAIPSTAGLPLRWKVTGNPASTVPNQAFIRAFDYGLSGSQTVAGDTIVPADYIGDRKTDVTVWRPSQGIFYVAEFPIGTGGVTLNRAVQWGGGTGDLARQGGDYDGDGKADYTIIRINQTNGNLTWFIKSSATGAERTVPFGTIGDADTAQIFPGADFTGDGRDELVFVTAFEDTGIVTYFVGDAVTGAGVMVKRFGDFNLDFSLAPGDYTGDGRADFVAVRQSTSPATWFINDSVTNTTTARPFGISDPGFQGGNDTPIRGDYDGDGKFDIAVFRRSSANFFYLRSSSNNTIVDGQRAGDPGDFALAGLAVNF
ncbi:MAG: VCBS repeat-containing protein [Acidobacteria bacterium]|nr:VCBS repeat-containing protein [Acidobacteriota bacterium]MCA1639192.1 VCBS repeat-containing protein [Acidobacteriota bacterium]